jgi:hypothetical protein
VSRVSLDLEDHRAANWDERDQHFAPNTMFSEKLKDSCATNIAGGKHPWRRLDCYETRQFLSRIDHVWIVKDYGRLDDIL